MARRATNNPRQVRSKKCGCKLCLEEYPPADFGSRRPRRDCTGSWQARYRNPAGRQLAKNFPISKGGYDAAVEFLDETRTAVRQRTYRDPERGRVRLDAWWEEFWSVEGKKGGITTRNRKLGIWRTHIRPIWGGYRLIDLEYMALQKWLTGLKGFDTQKKAKELMVALLQAAVRDGERIKINPAAHLEITAARVRKHPDDLKPPTREQYALIHAALPEYYQIIFRDFARETGMRPGEYAGLRRHCLDEEKRVVYIKEILILDNGRLRRQAVPKTEAGFRCVALTPRAWSAVQFMIEKWKPARTRSAVGDGFDLRVEELLLRGPKGRALNENNLRRPWRRATTQAGVAREFVNPETGRSEWWPRIYEYRHEVTTRLHGAGVPEADTQSHLGQKRGGKVTWIYTHASEGAQESVRAALTEEEDGDSGLRLVQ